MNVPEEAVQRAIDILNEIHRLDPTVLPKLIEYRVECNDAVADHPTVQVATVLRGDRNQHCEVGLLGIINGIVGCDANSIGYIAANFTEDNKELLDFGWTTKSA